MSSILSVHTLQNLNQLKHFKFIVNTGELIPRQTERFISPVYLDYSAVNELSIYGQ